MAVKPVYSVWHSFLCNNNSYIFNLCSGSLLEFSTLCVSWFFCCFQKSFRHIMTLDVEGSSKLALTVMSTKYHAPSDMHYSTQSVKAFSYFFLSFFKPGESNNQPLVHIILSKILHRSLVDWSCTVDITVLLFKSCILDPVLNLRVDYYE